MPYTESIGTFDKLWLSANGTAWSAIEFLDGSSIAAADTLTNPEGMRGTRQERGERTRWTQTVVNGQLNFAPNSAEIDLLLQWAIGSVKSGTGFPYAERPGALFVCVSRDGGVSTYSKVQAQSLTISCQEGSPVQFAVAVMGTIEVLGGSLPTAAIDDTTTPFVMVDGSLSINGGPVSFRNLQITIDNMLEPKFNNSLSPTSINSTGLKVTCAATLAFGEASALYGSGVSGGLPVVASFTNGSKTLAVSMPDVRAPRDGLALGGRRARDLVWRGVARQCPAGAAISVTNS